MPEEKEVLNGSCIIYDSDIVSCPNIPGGADQPFHYLLKKAGAPIKGTVKLFKDENYAWKKVRDDERFKVFVSWQLKED